MTSGQLYSLGGFFKSGGLSQPSEHWLEWASTPTGENPGARPSRPWPYYFTPHVILGTDASDWVYANRTFVMPAGFPNVEIGHRYTISAPGSGRICLDDLFFRTLPSPESSSWVELIPFRSGWRYSASAAPDWASANFRDSSWPLGFAKFGTGGGPTNVITALPAGKSAYYFRQSFVLSTWPCQDLLLSATCTEGVGGKGLEIHLNGSPLVTSGIDAVSGQGNRIEYYDLSPFADRLHLGTNTIAVVLNNVSQSSWDDVAFDLRLQMIPGSAPASSQLLGIQPEFDSRGNLQAVYVGVQIEPGKSCRIEASDLLQPANWQLLQRLTTDGLDALWVRDNVPSGGMKASRFYRLVPE